MTEFKRSSEDLEAKTRDLIRSNAELEQFAHVASHDLKEPLWAVGGFAEILREKYAGRLDAKGLSFFSYIVDGTDRMKRLIDDLLSLARVTTQARAFAPIDCNAVLEAASACLKQAIDDNRAVVTADKLPTAPGDETQLIQLFQNLIINALKYRRAAPPAIHFSVRPASEQPSLRGRGDQRVLVGFAGCTCQGMAF